MNIDQAVEKYVKLRDKRDAIKSKHKEELAPFNERLDKIEAAIMKFFNATGQNSCRTDHGTPYRSDVLSATVADRDAFLAFVQENDAYHFLENRVRKKDVEEYAKEHGEYPPGIKTSVLTKINVKRSS